MEGLLDALVRKLEAEGVSLELWALAWARVMPLVTVVPAFGARLLPPVGRVVLGLSLSLLLAPALAPALDPGVGAEGWPVVLLREVAYGVPVALGAAALLWAASMAGGLAEELRGSGQTSHIAMLEPDNNAIGALFGLFAALGFLALGGVSRALERLALQPESQKAWYVEAVRDLVAAIGIALALAAPLLALVIIVEVAGALIARAATPAHIRVLLAPLRALAVLAGLAFALDAMFRWLLEQLS